jgi:murein DD-endopeptidase MepM/ murein hydrolase activator NlpD
MVIEYRVYVCAYPYWHTPNACCDPLGGLSLFTEQPAPPQSTASIRPAVVEIVAQKSAVSAAPNSAAIASPEALPAQSAANLAAPSPEPSPSPLRAEPAPEPSPSPLRAEPGQHTPVAQPALSPVAPANQSAATQRRQEIEQQLAEIVSKQRAAQKAQQQQTAETEAAKYAGAGEFERAKQALSKQPLPKDVQAAILKRLKEQQAKIGKPGAIANGNQKPGTIPKGLSIAESGNGAAPSYTPPANSAGATSYSTQPILPSAQPLLQFPASLLGKNLNLIYPLAAQAPVTSGFGWRVHPLTGTPRFHRGLDLGAPYGSLVVAAKAGRVETADFIDGYGLTIVVRHNDTQQTLYAHLSEVLVKPGDWVKQGSLVGQVGSTGNSTGPHLHFEFLQMTSQGWTALDPAAVLNQAIATAQAAPFVKTGTGQTLRLSASGTFDINANPAIASGMIPGYSLIANLVQSSSFDEQTSLLFPFTMLPSAVPELGWLLSPFVGNFLAEQPNPLASFLALSKLPPEVLPPTVSFQSLPSLAKPLPQAIQLAGSPPVNATATVQARSRYSISRSTILQTALQPQQPEAPVGSWLSPTAVSAIAPSQTGAMPTATTPISTTTAMNHLTAFQNNLNSSPNSTARSNFKDDSGKKDALKKDAPKLSLVQIRSQQLPKASLEKLRSLNSAIDRQTQVKQVSDARVGK